MTVDATEYVSDPLAFFDLNDMPFFINCDVAPYDFFAVDPTGDADVDGKLGTHLAEIAIDYSRKQDNSACIALALCSIVERGKVTALEAGFIARIADAVTSHLKK